MENEKEHHELMLTLAVFQATMEGKLDAIAKHLSALNGQTSKNSGAITELQENNRSLGTMVYNMVKQERERIIAEQGRNEINENKREGWKKSWQNLLFGTLQWVIPALIVGLLVNGPAIAKFFGLLP